ncbi:hypothetical protein [Desulfothermobacter acidiphilus]
MTLGFFAARFVVTVVLRSPFLKVYNAVLVGTILEVLFWSRSAPP